jgi:hypothetical protein
MAQVTAQHVPVLTAGFVGLLVFALLGVAALNHFANR